MAYRNSCKIVTYDNNYIGIQCSEDSDESELLRMMGDAKEFEGWVCEITRKGTIECNHTRPAPVSQVVGVFENFMRN